MEKKDLRLESMNVSYVVDGQQKYINGELNMSTALETIKAKIEEEESTDVKQ